MAIPALDKEWQGGTTLSGIDLVNVVVSGTSNEVLCKNALFQIKTAFTTFNSNPWTVAGSSNSTAAGMDATDRWSSTADLTYRASTGTAFSWVVLNQPQINPNFQVLFGMDNTSASDASRFDLYISVSPSAGFGSVASGTNGSTTALPTAVDEHVLNTTTSTWYGGTVPSNASMLTCISSTDGECTRVIATRETTGLDVMRMNFEVPKNPHVSWYEPCVYGHNYQNANTVFRREEWQSTTTGGWGVTVSGVYGNNNKEQLPAVFFSPKFVALEALDAQEDDQVRFFYGELISVAQTAALKPLGTLHDWYWVSRNTGGFHAVNLDTFPAAGNRTYVCMGDCVYGWLNDSSTELKYEDV